jgi:hypothetical protein
MSTDHAK